VLQILKRHAGGHVRAMGARHSWSDAAASQDVCLDMGRLARVELHAGFVRVGAGCRLQELLDELRVSGRTLPTLGAIKRQTISGAISTGTHGSGSPSLSHFVSAIRIAAYDSGSGEPKIYEYRGGDELEAARCAVGCAGVILSVDLPTVPNYKVRESLRHLRRLEEALSCVDACPLTQFALIPYRWDYLVFERTAVADRALSLSERARALFFRVYHWAWMDWIAHFGVKLALLLGSAAQVRLQKWTPCLTLTYRARLDDAERVLTLGHHYFRHEEMELCVPASRLAPAIELLRDATEAFAGRGEYTQHYPFLIRRILPEATLISMAAAAREPWYSISVFTYHVPRRRAGYYAFCAWLARAMHEQFQARLHWGKHFPLTAAHVGRAHSGLDRFRQFCRAVDARGVFHNAFAERVLGLRRIDAPVQQRVG
jgi:hypothetical protein